MIDGPSVLVGTVAGGLWLLYLLVAAGRILRDNQWPFFIPRALTVAWQQADNRGARWAGALILLIIVAAFTLVPLSLGAAFLLLAQAFINAMT